MDKYGFLLASKNADVAKAYLIKNIADAAMHMKPNLDEDDLPLITVETIEW